jgi:hypothetical protein
VEDCRVSHGSPIAAEFVLIPDERWERLLPIKAAGRKPSTGLRDRMSARGGGQRPRDEPNQGTRFRPNLTQLKFIPLTWRHISGPTKRTKYSRSFMLSKDRESRRHRRRADKLAVFTRRQGNREPTSEAA